MRKKSFIAMLFDGAQAEIGSTENPLGSSALVIHRDFCRSACKSLPDIGHEMVRFWHRKYSVCLTLYKGHQDGVGWPLESALVAALSRHMAKTCSSRNVVGCNMDKAERDFWSHSLAYAAVPLPKSTLNKSAFDACLIVLGAANRSKGFSPCSCWRPSQRLMAF
jgi:hypothetical protein